MNVRFRLFSVILLILSFLVFCDSVCAGGLAFNDKRSLKLFKKDYSRYSGYFDNINPAERGELEGYLVKLESYMNRVSSAGKEDPQIIDCVSKIDGLKQKMAQAFSEGGNASFPHVNEAKALIEKSNVAGLSRPELNKLLMDLQGIHRQVKIAHQKTSDSAGRDTYEEVRDALSDAVTKTRKKLEAPQVANSTVVSAPARNTAPVRSTVTASSKTMSDGDIARQFQKDYNDAYNTVRRTRGKDYLNDSVVKDIQGKLQILKGHIDSISDESQPFYRQMKANHDNLQAHLKKAVASAQKQKEQTLALNAVREAQAVARATKNATVSATATTVQPSSSGATSAMVVPIAKLSYSARRAVTMFQKEQSRRMYNFDNIIQAQGHEYQTYLKKLERLLDPISPAEKGNKEAAACFEQLDKLKGKFAAAFPEGVREVVKAPKPLGIADAKMVNLFDTDLARYKGMFKRANVDEMLVIRECLEKLQKHLDRVGFHGKKHEDYIKRVEQLAQVKADVNEAFGELRPFTKEEEDLLSEFRATFNGTNYKVTSNLNPIYLQNPEQRKEIEKELAASFAILNRIENKNHPRFLTEMARFKELEDKYRAAVATSDKMDDLAGDVDGQLEMVQKQFNKETFDPALPANANYAQIEEWAAKLKNWQVAAEEAVRFFEHAEKYSLKAKSNEFFQYAHWFKQNVGWDIKQALKKAERDFRAPVHAGLTPSIGGQSSSNPQAVERELSNIKKGKHGVRCLMAYQQGYEGKIDPELHKNLQTMDELISKVSGKANEAIENRRMPVAASTSPELIAIAKKAIAEASEEWEIGEYVRMVINYDKQHKSEVRYHDGTFYKLVWDEFQVTLAEKAGEEYWTRTAMLKYYYVGGEQRWKVVRSHRWGKILEENIHK